MSAPVYINQQLIVTALADAGIREIPGDKNNPRIMEFLKSTGLTWVNSEETPWCSAAMWHWVQAAGGYVHKEEKRKRLLAKAWLALEADTQSMHILKLKDMQVGDVCILWRERRRSYKGHVGIFCGVSGGYIRLVGGNQNNSVSLKGYPTYRFLEGRRIRQVIGAEAVWCEPDDGSTEEERSLWHDGPPDDVETTEPDDPPSGSGGRF